MANYVFLFLGNLGTAKVKESSQQVSSISSDLILPSRRRPPRPLVSGKLSSSSNIVLTGREKEHEDVDIPLAYQTGAPKTCMNSFVLFCCFFLFCSVLFCFVLFCFFSLSIHFITPNDSFVSFLVIYCWKNEQECIIRFKNSSNLVPRSLVDEAEGEIWSNPICTCNCLSGM